eukprot:CAMPEP_0115425498 /NCGR_PEP_ID=MMETSP0271-20121206/28411_1 /TAXON_ID=71861 /ORGANISM="Scrippsiella trochoidea, Strain CCMP3099" /LENGTH=70 /DNA_ID=CAMNT_0002850399 /DNA_START=43 /DNA_END=255 /DNA_ORIENTATION=+
MIQVFVWQNDALWMNVSQKSMKAKEKIIDSKQNPRTRKGHQIIGKCVRLKSIAEVEAAAMEVTPLEGFKL